MKLTIEDVRKRVALIAAANDDPSGIHGHPGGAHGQEDDLWSDVLQAIASGAPDARELAKEALRTQRLDFERRCA